MARVSLKEAYDNKDVVAQIYAIRDIAEGASDTADSAKTTADGAKTYVDTLGVQVEGAVQTANNASASAQESAETVSQYDARLTEVEGDLNQAESDIDGLETGLNAVTLRVQTAEGNIVTIQGRVTALETADGQNVKLTGPNAIGNYAVLLTGNQVKTGTLFFKNAPTIQAPDYVGYAIQNQNIENWGNTPPDVTVRQRIFSIADKNNSQYLFRLNLDITTSGEVRLNYERRQIVNGVNTYNSGYLL